MSPLLLSQALVMTIDEGGRRVVRDEADGEFGGEEAGGGGAGGEACGGG